MQEQSLLLCLLNKRVCVHVRACVRQPAGCLGEVRVSSPTGYWVTETDEEWKTTLDLTPVTQHQQGPVSIHVTCVVCQQSEIGSRRVWGGIADLMGHLHCILSNDEQNFCL